VLLWVVVAVGFQTGPAKTKGLLLAILAAMSSTWIVNTAGPGEKIVSFGTKVLIKSPFNLSEKVVSSAIMALTG